MSVLIIPVCGALIFLNIERHYNEAGSYESLRHSIVITSIFMGILSTVFIEIPSLFNAVNYVGISILWSFTAVMNALFLIFRYKHSKFQVFNSKILFPDSHFSILISIGLVLLCGAVVVIGLLTPPNNLDSLTYHMARVFHWTQNNSVAHYPTHTLRQLHQCPWAEYAIMHLQILSDGDRFALFVQWFSMIGSIVVGSLVAKELGLAAVGQLIAAAITATIPMGILQGSSTQNDFAASYWLIVFLYWTLRIIKHKKGNCNLVSEVFFAGSALGLALLTKATAYLYATPFVILVLYRIFFDISLKFRTKLMNGMLILILVLSSNVFFYIRNYSLYNSILGPGIEGQKEYVNEEFTPSILASNVMRNASLELTTPFQRINTIMENCISKFHTFLHMSVNDPRCTWEGSKFRVLPRIFFHEDYTGNLIHSLLIIASCIFLVFSKKWRSQKLPIIYAICLVSAFLLFCLVLRWQQWHTRLHLPLYVMASPLVATMITSISMKVLRQTIVIVLILQSFSYIFINETRPPLWGKDSLLTISRDELYFINQQHLKKNYFSAVSMLRKGGYTCIGLTVGSGRLPHPFSVPGFVEYPLLMLLTEGRNEQIRIDHVDVDNISRILTAPTLKRDCLIGFRMLQNDIQEYMKKGWLAIGFGPLTLFVHPNSRTHL